MKANKSPKKQARRKSSKKQLGRKSPRKSVPTWNSLKKFAPLSVRLRPSTMEKWKRTAWEGTFDVERTIRGTLSDIFDPYYNSNAEKHHVWTDNLVIRTATKLDRTRLAPGVPCLGIEGLERYNLDCLDDPEKKIYLKELGERMGHGLFARQEIPANSIVGEYTGELISKEEWSKRWKNNKKTKTCNYFFKTCKNMTIDAGAMGNHTRFINHDCGDKLNCRTEFALINGIPRNFILNNRAIGADEQLFIWYGKGYFKDMDCLCDSVKCLSK